jgi:hypothetical protein
MRWNFDKSRAVKVSVDRVFTGMLCTKRQDQSLIWFCLLGQMSFELKVFGESGSHYSSFYVTGCRAHDWRGEKSLANDRERSILYAKAFEEIKL